MTARKELIDPLRCAAETLITPTNPSEEEFRYVEMSREWRDELLDPAGWHRVLETFAHTMRLAVALTDSEGRLLGQCHNPQPTWRAARRVIPDTNAGCRFCLAPPSSCNAVPDALRMGGVTVVEDQAGLAHVAVPLSLGGQQLGALIAGQVFSRYPEPLRIERAARDAGVSRQVLWQESIQQVPVTGSTLQLYAKLLISLGQAFLGERYAVILHRKLAQTSQRYRLFIEGVKGYSLHTVDRAGRVNSWNSGAERLFGYTESEIIGLDSSILLAPGKAQPGGRRKRWLKPTSQDAIEREAWRVRKDGTRFFGASVVASVGTEGAREYGELIHDVTELRQSQQDLQQAQRLESIGVLAGGIAHDFNNLLTGIMMSLGLAKMGLPPDHPAYPMVEIAEQSSARAAELVAQLLAHAGKGKFVITRFDISALISEMLPFITASIPKTVNLELSLASDLPWIEADASQIRQIVMNLIINGAEAIGPEGGIVKILSGVSNSGTDVFMQVKDSGCGMNEATKAKMFDPFFTTKLTGRGLGLAAVSGIVCGHNGTMQVDSAPGQGATFTVSFPGVQAAIPSPVEPPSSNLPPHTGTILIVDDEPVLRRVAGTILEKSGHSVVYAKDGREAVAVFQQNMPNIAAVLLDVTMPVMGGHEAFRLIREIQPGVPIIMSSGYSEVFAPEEVGHDGTAGFIQKPYSANKLLETVESALQRPARG
jgi:PAS domain S-box-containing protein